MAISKFEVEEEQEQQQFINEIKLFNLYIRLDQIRLLLKANYDIIRC